MANKVVDISIRTTIDEQTNKVLKDKLVLSVQSAFKKGIEEALKQKYDIKLSASFDNATAKSGNKTDKSGKVIDKSAATDADRIAKTYEKLTTQIIRMKNRISTVHKTMKTGAVIKYSNSYSKLINDLKRAQITEDETNETLEEKKKLLVDIKSDMDDLSASISGNMQKQQSWGKTLSAQIKKLTTYLTATKLITMTIGTLKSIVNEIIKLDKAFTNIQMVTGYNANQIANLREQYTKLAQSLGASVEEVAEGADAWLRMGLAVEDANKAVETSIVLSKISGMNSEEASKALITTMKAYKMNANELMGVADKLSAVDMQAATTSQDIAEGISEVGSMASASGVSLDKLIGYIAEISQVTQESGSEAGTALKTMFARMQNVKLGNFLDEDGENISNVEQILEEYNIHLRDTRNEWRSMEDVLDELGKKWNTFSSVQKSAIATQLAGTRQQNKIITLLNNYTEATKLATVATESEGEAMNKMNIYTESIAGKIETVRAKLSEVKQKILSSDAVKMVIDIADWVATILADTGKLQILISIIGGIIAGISIAVGILTGNVAAIVQGGVLAAAVIAADIYLGVTKVDNTTKDIKDNANDINNSASDTADSIEEIEKHTNNILTALDKTYNLQKAIQQAYSDENEERKKQLEYEEKILAVQEKQKALAEAERKRVKVYRAGKGFVYETDFAGVSPAQKELTKSKEELKTYETERELKKIKKLQDYVGRLITNDAKLSKFFDDAAEGMANLGETAEEAQAKIQSFLNDYFKLAGVSGATEYLTNFEGDKETKENFTSGLKGLGIETHHSGGVVGAPNSSFTFGALKNDEIIAKLQKGEIVLTRRQKDNLVKNFISNNETSGNVSIGNITLPNVSNAEQFVNELKSISRMSLQRATTHK